MSLKIDSHQHFWNYDSVRYSWIDEPMRSIQKDFLPKDLQPLLEKNNFNGCIAVQADQSEEETKFLLKLAEENNFIKGVVGWVDFTSPEVGTRLEQFARNPLLKGLRHTVYDQDGKYLQDPGFQTGISLLHNFNLTYDVLVFDYQLPGAVELVRKFPDQPFVLNHMAKPQILEGVNFEWKKYMEVLGACSNVYCKISGLVTETAGIKWEQKHFVPFLDIALNSFGEDKLMFGSDWPVSLTAAGYSETVSIVKEYFSACSKEVQNKIFGENAAEFYNLKV